MSDLVMTLAHKLEDTETENLIEAVFEHVKSDNALLNEIVNDFVQNLAEKVHEVREVIKAYKNYGDLIKDNEKQLKQ